MTKEQVFQNFNDLPLGLFSHSDQVQQWQTSIPNDRSSVGWGGRIADLMSSMNTSADMCTVLEQVERALLTNNNFIMVQGKNLKLFADDEPFHFDSRPDRLVHPVRR